MYRLYLIAENLLPILAPSIKSNSLVQLFENQQICMKTRHLQQPNYQWSKEEDILLNQLYTAQPEQWMYISSVLPHKDEYRCLKRYKKIKNLILKHTNRAWSIEEDQNLLKLFDQYSFEYVTLSTHFPKCNPTDVYQRLKILLPNRMLKLEDLDSKSVQEIENPNIKIKELKQNTTQDVMKTRLPSRLNQDYTHVQNDKDKSKFSCPQLKSSIQKYPLQNEKCNTIKWNPKMDKNLNRFYAMDPQNWENIAYNLAVKDPAQCKRRYLEIYNISSEPPADRRWWTAQEDQLLKLQVEQTWTWNWTLIQKYQKSISVDQSYYRYVEILRDEKDIKQRKKWTVDQLKYLWEKYKDAKNKTKCWQRLKLCFRHRSETSIRKKIKQMIENKNFFQVLPQQD